MKRSIMSRYLSRLKASLVLLLLTLNSAAAMEQSPSSPPVSIPLPVQDGEAPSKSVNLATETAPALLCLPPDQARTEALRTGKARLVLSLESYRPPREGGQTITVKTASTGADPETELAKLGLFPATAIGPGDPARQFFLPAEAAKGLRSDETLCLTVSIGTGKPATSQGDQNGEALFSLSSQQLQ